MAWDRLVRTLERQDVGRKYQLWIHTPARYDPDTHYPLVFCLDAPWTFGTATDIVRLQSTSRLVEPSIVVGLAHDTDKRDVLDQRAADFTVSQFQPPSFIGVRAPASELGGAEEFRVWLTEVVLPHLGDWLQVKHIVLVGHSLSALFGLHVLFNAPETFAGYVLASPSVWWDNQVMFETEAKYAAANSDLAARVFMSMGELEDDEFVQAQVSSSSVMSLPGLGDHQVFHDKLAGRNYPSLELQWHRFEGEHHASVPSAAINRGLSWLLAPPAE